MLITAAEVADTLPGLSPTDTQLLAIVADTDSWAKRVLGRNFERKTYTEVVRGEGHPFVYLLESPIRSVTEIRIDPLGNFDADTTVDDLTQFFFDPDPDHDSSRLSWLGFDAPAYIISGYVGVSWIPFPEHARAARVTYEAGFWPADDPVNVCDLPYDLRSRLIKRARVEFKLAQGKSDEETKAYDLNMILRELSHFKRA